MLIFAFAATQEVKNVRMAVYNRDTGIYARDLVARFEGSPNFAEVRHLQAEPDIARAIDSRSVLLVVHIREDFSRELAAGRPASVQLILDGRSSNASQILAGYAEAIMDSYNEELTQTRKVPPPASTVVSRVWFNPNLDALWSTVPSLVAILAALEGLMVTALSVARERELGTFEQLLVSPLSPAEIVVGKTVPALLIGWGEGTLMVTVAVLVFRVPLTGSWRCCT
jgi:ABC-2 type transport system permease protein